MTIVMIMIIVMTITIMAMHLSLFFLIDLLRVPKVRNTNSDCFVPRHAKCSLITTPLVLPPSPLP